MERTDLMQSPGVVEECAPFPRRPHGEQRSEHEASTRSVSKEGVQHCTGRLGRISI